MKKNPLRMCLGCREMKPKTDLIRVVKSPENEVSIDPTGKKNGRGAYICLDPNCFKRIVKSNALSRTFKTQIPEGIIIELQEKQVNMAQTGNNDCA